MPSKNPSPLYQADIKLHLAADPLWEREDNYNTRRITQAPTADGLFQGVVRSMFEVLGMKNDLVVYGLILNMVNQFPEEIRANFVMGIATGLGAKFVKEDGKSTLKFETLFDALPLPNTEQVTEGGLILPPKEELEIVRV